MMSCKYKLFLILFFSLLIGSLPAGYAVPDYLGIPPDGEYVSPTTFARIGDLVTAEIVLERRDVVPEEAKLNITTELTRPDFKITIDNDTISEGSSEFERDLPSEGVTKITIRVSGYAPTVEKLTKIDILSVKTYVKYRGEDGIYQDDGRLALEISDTEIREAQSETETAKLKLAEAEGIVNLLKSQEINTVSLESQIQIAKDLIDDADELHERGQADLAKNSATRALSILDQVISDASKQGKDEKTEGDIKKYVTIAGAVILVILVILFISRRREELG